MADSMCNGLGCVIGLLETNDFADYDILRGAAARLSKSITVDFDWPSPTTFEDITCAGLCPAMAPGGKASDHGPRSSPINHPEYLA